MSSFFMHMPPDFCTDSGLPAFPNLLQALYGKILQLRFQFSDSTSLQMFFRGVFKELRSAIDYKALKCYHVTINDV